MKKKALSLALALAMGLSLTVSASAALQEVTLKYDGMEGNDKPGDLIVKNVISTSTVTGKAFDNSYTLYDVAVGDVLFQQFCPAADGADTVYEYFVREGEQAADGSFVSAADHETPLEISYEIGSTDNFLDFYAAKGGDDHFTFTCTDADIGKAYCISLTFEVQTNGGADRRSAAQIENFFLRVNPAQPAVPSGDSIPASGTAVASTQTVTVDGREVEFQMYALKDENDNLTNYIKLRDIAYVLNGTKAQFSVGYNNAAKSISLTTGQPYQAGGTEMTTPFSGDRAYTGGVQALRIDGKDAAMTAITLTDDNGGGYNYFKLRDLGRALGFNVGYSNETGVFLETDKPYAE